MLAKLKIAAIAGVGLFVLSTMLSFIYKTYQLQKSIDNFTAAKTEVVTTGVTENTLVELNQRLENNEKTTKDSLQRLEDLKGEIETATQEISKPTQHTVTVKTVYSDKPATKEADHESQKNTPDGNTAVVMRAFDELWRDFCERFPDERDCRERKVQSENMQARPATRS